MASVYYNLSAQLRQNLLHINSLRNKIAAQTLPPSVLINKRWQVLLERIWCWHTLLGNPLKRNDIATLLTQGRHKTISKIPKVISTIYWDWLASNRPITFASIQTLADTLRISIPNPKQTKEVVYYLQSENLNPVVQAAISHLMLRESLLGFIVPLMYLYRGGFDLQGLVNSESILVKEKIEYCRQLGLSKTNATLWLEYYSQIFLNHMIEIDTQLQTSLSYSPYQVVNLSERQKKILDKLSNPSMSITNKVVQSLFKVSQITASRDLSELAHLGLIISQGKGRSIKYMRIF